MAKKQDLEVLEEELKNKQICDCEIYSRVVGYFRPVKQWNPGKQAEWSDRKKYAVPPGTN